MNSTAPKPSALQRFSALDWRVRLAVGALGSIAALIVCVQLIDMFNFSVGERAGVLSKLSNKGFVCWTTEGELAQLNFSKSTVLRSNNTQVDNTFYFSVPDPEVRKQLEDIPSGSPISLQYNQKLFALDLPFPLLCRRRTQFEIVGVRRQAN
jgi:hypothetical protein